MVTPHRTRSRPEPSPLDPSALVTVSPYGLLIPDADLHLDVREAPGLIFVSHAHSDHCADRGPILCTPETAHFHTMRRGPLETLRLPYGATHTIGASEIELRPAGHVLGSAMIVATSAHGRIAYTGDFKLRANPLSPRAEPPVCDVLVMECTFGEPRYRFPKDEELYARLFAFIDETLASGGTPAVLAYALGKSQEVLWHLMGAGYDVAAHGSIASLCR